MNGDAPEKRAMKPPEPASVGHAAGSGGAPASPFLAVEGIAAFLRVKTSTVYEWTRRRGPGSIPRYKGGRCLLFDPAEVLDWFRETRRVGQDLGNERRPRRRMRTRRTPLTAFMPSRKVRGATP